MHELSIAMSILDVAQEEVDRRGGPRVEAIHLRMGPLAGIVKDALLSAYELACEQTPFERSRLMIEEIPIVVFCSKCQAERSVQSLQWLCCVECDTPATDILHGRELEVTALELSE
jgi:hydrogenase nickel incorporation protein HypA/HybF